jgi:hypothetical protein
VVACPHSIYFDFLDFQRFVFAVTVVVVCRVAKVVTLDGLKYEASLAM